MLSINPPKCPLTQQRSDAEALLDQFIEAYPEVEHVVLGNSFGTTIASASAPAAKPSTLPLGGLCAAIFGVTAETIDKLGAAKTRNVVAHYADFTLLQFSAFPLVLAITVAPDADPDAILEVRSGLLAALGPSACVTRGFLPVLQAAPALLTAFEPLRAAAEQLM